MATRQHRCAPSMRDSRCTALRWTRGAGRFSTLTVFISRCHGIVTAFQSYVFLLLRGVV